MIQKNTSVYILSLGVQLILTAEDLNINYPYLRYSKGRSTYLIRITSILYFIPYLNYILTLQEN